MTKEELIIGSFKKGYCCDLDEIKDYLKRIDELEAKLTGEDKETYTWLIYGYNQCAKLLNETEQQCKKQKEVIDKLSKIIYEIDDLRKITGGYPSHYLDELLDILNEVSE